VPPHKPTIVAKRERFLLWAENRNSSKIIAGEKWKTPRLRKTQRFCISFFGSWTKSGFAIPYLCEQLIVGCDNRAFFHLKRDDEGAVAARIAEIRSEGYEPKIDILAHGFKDEETALRVEAAAIDLLDRSQLLNERGGFESREFGRYPVDEVAALYSQDPIKIRGKDAVLLIRINQLYYAGMPAQELYEITRGIWRLSIERAQTVQ